MSNPSVPTPAERAHFAAIGRAMSEEKRDQLQRAAARDTAEGILEGLELARLSSPSPEIDVEERCRAAGQIGIRLHWRARGRRP